MVSLSLSPIDLGSQDECIRSGGKIKGLNPCSCLSSYRILTYDSHSLSSPHRNLDGGSRWPRVLRSCLSPRFLNIFCFIVPLLFALKTSFWTISLIISINLTHQAHSQVIDLTSKAASEWIPGRMINIQSETSIQLEKALELYSKRLHRVALDSRISSLQGNVAGLMVFIVSERTGLLLSL